jgi:hypothetical protein
MEETPFWLLNRPIECEVSIRFGKFIRPWKPADGNLCARMEPPLFASLAKAVFMLRSPRCPPLVSWFLKVEAASAFLFLICEAAPAFGTIREVDFAEHENTKCLFIYVSM